MTQADHRTQLDEQLRAIEEAARAIDAGEAPLPAAGRIAAALAAVFQAEGTAPSLLSRAGGTYARLASSVPKPPYPQNLFLPVVQVTLQMGGGGGFVMQASTGVGATELAERPRCAAPLGRAAAFRQVQAPDWWKTEPVVVVEHSKLTRRDLTLSSLAGEDRPVRDGRPLPLRIALNYGVTLEVPWPEARAAALRQFAHELLSSAELLKLAGRARR